MNANQAKTIADSINFLSNKPMTFDEVVADMNLFIKEAAESGKYQVDYNPNMKNRDVLNNTPQLIRNHFKKNGFTLSFFKDGDPRYGDDIKYIIISWRDFK